MYWIYCLSFLFGTSLLERGRFSGIAYKLSLVIVFVFMTGNYYNGIDWINYQYHYGAISQGSGLFDSLVYEPGFMLIMYFFGNLLGIDNFHVVVFFSCTIATISISKFIKKLPFKINRSLFLFATVAFIFPLFNDAIRQLLAFSVLVPFLPEIRTCSLKKLALICVSASLFHASAFLIFPILIILRMQLTKQLMLKMFIFLVAFIILLLSLDAFVSLLSSVIPQLLYAKLVNYLEKTSELKIGFFAIIDCIGLFLIYITSRSTKEDSKLSLYAIGGCLFFLLHLAFYTAPFLQRLLYFIFPLVIVYAEVIFLRGAMFSLNKLLLPVAILMSVSVFIRNVTNPYYASDFSEPKFFYSELFSNAPIDIETLKSAKCMTISEFDPGFCPR